MTNSMYILGQILGIFSTMGSIARPFFKKKVHILWMNIFVNLLVALNYILIGQFGSGAMLGLVCIVQSLCSIGHETRGTQTPNREIILFGFLYLIFGLIGVFSVVGFPPPFAFSTLLELTSLAGTALMMAAIYAPNEQATRKCLLVSGTLWTIYALSKGSSTFLTNATSASAAGIALWRYSKQHKE